MTSPRWTIAASACACAAAGAYVFAVDPSGGGPYPHCLFYQTTGLYCAGCGATRALHALLHGRIFEALHDNVLFVLLLPVALTLVARFTLLAWRNNQWPQVNVPPRLLGARLAAIVVIAALFMAIRNIPGAPFDLLRPLA